MKKALAWILCLMLAAVPSWALTIDMDYEGKVDSQTGLPAGSSSAAEQADGIVKVSAGVTYDRTDKMFIYRLADGGDVRCSVVDGMMTTGIVRIEVPAGVQWTMYYDGRQMAAPDLNDLSVPGDYSLLVGNGEQSQRSISFTVLNGVTGRLKEYFVPEGFAVTQVLFDGEKQRVQAKRVDLTEEGEYEITYHCQASGEAYFLNVTVDHTPPTLALEAVEDGVAKGPVDISDLESGAAILIRLDNEVEPYSETLTKSGSYTITVEDQAGNANIYQFVLQVYFNTSSLLLFAVIFLLLAGLLAFMLLSKKRLRVR